MHMTVFILYQKISCHVNVIQGNYSSQPCVNTIFHQINFFPFRLTYGRARSIMVEPLSSPLLQSPTAIPHDWRRCFLILSLRYSGGPAPLGRPPPSPSHTHTPQDSFFQLFCVLLELMIISVHHTGLLTSYLQEKL